MSCKDMFAQCVIRSVSNHWPVGRWPPMSVSPDTLDEVCTLMGALAGNMEEDVFGCERAGADYDRDSNVLVFHVASEDIIFTGSDYQALLRLGELASSIHFLSGGAGAYAVMSVVFGGLFKFDEEVNAGE